MAMQTVGIVGARTMGNGIAQACAVAGFDVVLLDISAAATQKGLARVSSTLDRLVSGGKASEAEPAWTARYPSCNTHCRL
ncbi:hypothetical protein DN412_28425 [Cupriavidus lacunae]|uniref:3-hydroxyacyl-CoA dehydrogenase NAD binding domain-containing protein n=1 Tax=Cupriavidus lacunae TaxID=2666307 RepID=A0A370NMZ9_9BURK|nr:hypothetical protein DN412_28425 [Cupriavidus lacunae]